MSKLRCLLTIATCSVVGLSAHAQKTKKLPDTIGVFLDVEDSLHYMSYSASISPAWLNYVDVKGKSKSTKQKEIKWMIIYDMVYATYPMKENGKMPTLMKVVAMNEEYILLDYDMTMHHWFIYDYEGKMKTEMLIHNPKQDPGWQKKNRDAITAAETYFKDCPDLIKVLEDNYKAKKDLNEELGFFASEDAPEVMDFLKGMHDMPWFKEE